MQSETSVKASGIDIAFPPENAELQERVAGEGLLLAEQPPGTEPLARFFPSRNRIIAGLAQGTVVVEAAPRSGSLITARLAGEAGREGMAVPGHPADPRAQGCNMLIREGATLIQSAGDILEQIRPIDARMVRAPESPYTPPPPQEASDADRARVTDLLGLVAVSVDELMRGMIVQSGNDACIALAELIAGSEDAFAQLMNREAKRLGMVNSQFMNASGLPDAQHYSSARDLYLLASALLRDFPQQYATYYALKEYRYNNITQPNRNRLLWMDPSVDGLKTGHTDAAGYCLIASKKI